MTERQTKATDREGLSTSYGAMADARASQDGYVAAFHHMGKLLGVDTARTGSPAQVWQNEMLPRLMELKRIESRRWTWGYSDGAPGTPEYEPAPRICKLCDKLASRCTCAGA